MLFRGVPSSAQPLKARQRSHRQVLDELNDKLADKYICNFSVFQSLPDTWAIDQILPIMPIHRLGEAAACVVPCCRT